MTTRQLESPSPSPFQGWKCPDCGLPGVRLSTNPDGSSAAPNRAYYKCVPCNRALGLCPCTTPGARTTSTCPCGDSDAESPGLEEVPKGVSLVQPSRKGSLNPHNPEMGFDVDWEANCSPGYMVSRFPARGMVPRSGHGAASLGLSTNQPLLCFIASFV